MSVKFYPLPFSVTLWCADIALQSVKPPNKKKKKAQKAETVLSAVIYIYIYIEQTNSVVGGKIHVGGGGGDS